MTNIYINKKQLSILSIGLMSLTRDDKAFDYGLEKGAFEESDIYSYIDTLKELIKGMEKENGAILSTEVNFEENDYTKCFDFWGCPVEDYI
jgi:hypothetical protein